MSSLIKHRNTSNVKSYLQILYLNKNKKLALKKTNEEYVGKDQWHHDLILTIYVNVSMNKKSIKFTQVIDRYLIIVLRCKI